MRQAKKPTLTSLQNHALGEPPLLSYVQEMGGSSRLARRTFTFVDALSSLPIGAVMIIDNPFSTDAVVAFNTSVVWLSRISRHGAAAVRTCSRPSPSSSELNSFRHTRH